MVCERGHSRRAGPPLDARRTTVPDASSRSVIRASRAPGPRRRPTSTTRSDALASTTDALGATGAVRVRRQRPADPSHRSARQGLAHGLRRARRGRRAAGPARPQHAPRVTTSRAGRPARPMPVGSASTTTTAPDGQLASMVERGGERVRVVHLRLAGSPVDDDRRDRRHDLDVHAGPPRRLCDIAVGCGRVRLRPFGSAHLDDPAGGHGGLHLRRERSPRTGPRTGRAG